MSIDARWVVVGWTLFGLSGVARGALLAYTFERPVSSLELWGPMVAACIWAALTPLAGSLVAAFPLVPGRKARGILALLAAGPLLATACLALFHAGAEILSPGSPDPFGVVREVARGAREGLVRVLPVAWALLAILHAVAAARREQAAALGTARLEADLAEATLATARAEVDPALLLGTLDELGALILRDQRAAEDVIVRLGDLLRTRDAADAARREEIARDIRCLLDAGLTPPSPAGS